MNEEVKAKWIAALRSGEYKQGDGVLRDVEDNFCCLGVLCDLAVKEGIIPEAIKGPKWYGYGEICDVAFLPSEIREWAGHPSTNRVMSMNDNGKKFKTIAKHIEENL